MMEDARCGARRSPWGITPLWRVAEVSFDQKRRREAGIALAGGHSIDSPEPIFGLAVNGLVAREKLKTNGGARAGDLLFLTKPLGVGILATAEKKGRLGPGDAGKAAASMVKLNRIGVDLAGVQGVHAITDVTGFGLLGHLGEMCAASHVRAEIDFPAVPLITDLGPYLDEGLSPGGARRNWESYGHLVQLADDRQRMILSDPQTSGGLLLAVDPSAQAEVTALLTAGGLQDFARPIGRLHEAANDQARIFCA